MNKHKEIKIASIFGIIGNIFLLIIKGTIGFICHSESMIADTFNSAGDIFTSLMTFIGNKISSKPSDEDHNLGHGKAEYIFSLIISVVMILSSILLIKNSIVSITNNDKATFSIWLIIVCSITILVKFALFIYTNILYKKYN
nr:cation diffusion facilitator family transporter [Bacilli bacterium]